MELLEGRIANKFIVFLFTVIFLLMKDNLNNLCEAQCFSVPVFGLVSHQFFNFNYYNLFCTKKAKHEWRSTSL